MNHLILIYIILCAAFTIWNPFPLFFVTLFVGPMLVGFIMIFDRNISMLHEGLLAETRSLLQGSNDADKKKRYEECVKNDERNCRQAADVFLKLDVPIMAGVIFTFVTGMLIFPSEVNIYIDEPYAIGFASGSTVLQLLVGNVSFAVIGFLSGR